jgi:subtilisin family serine protease
MSRRVTNALDGGLLRWIKSYRGFAILALIASAAIALGRPVPRAEFRHDQILIKPKATVSGSDLASFHAAQRFEVARTFEGLGRIQVLRLPKGVAVQEAIQRYTRSGLVEFAEPDHIVRAATTVPNDPAFLDGSLWGLDNFGQNSGAADADIDAPEAWNIIRSASNIVVAVLDTGVRYTHEDLASNMWVNPNDGGHGFNAFNGSSDPMDDNGHGTIMAGIIGAVGNNGIGVTGVAWDVQLMACKCLNVWGHGSDSTVIASIEFARTNGARLICASMESTGFSQAVSNAIVAARDDGIIFVASAGNHSGDIDASPRYPASYDIDNIISVAYTDRFDMLGTFSNHGATNVDLAAPGNEIYSTFGSSDSAYYLSDDLVDEKPSGTSLAAAYVSGALALLLERFPQDDYRQIIHRVLNTTDPLPDLAGKCVTGGRLNVRSALCPPIRLLPLQSAEPGRLEMRVSAGPGRTCVVEASTDLATWSPILTNSTGTNWSFDVIADHTTNAAHRFFRAVAEP